jgi:hypothetical protein
MAQPEKRPCVHSISLSGSLRRGTHMASHGRIDAVPHGGALPVSMRLFIWSITHKTSGRP